MQALFNAFGIKLSLLLAQAVNFAIVLAAITYFLYKPMMKLLAERQALVAKGVEDARLAGEKLSHADGEALGKVKAAEAQAGEIVKSAREAASIERSRVLAEADARAAALARDAAARAEEATARAHRESERDVARLAMLAAEKLILKHD